MIVPHDIAAVRLSGEEKGRRKEKKRDERRKGRRKGDGSR